MLDNITGTETENVEEVRVSAVQDWAQNLILDVRERCFILIRHAEQEDIYEQTSSTPQSFYCLESANSYLPLMQYYFSDFILQCLHDGPCSDAKKSLIAFFQENTEDIQHFLYTPTSRTQAEWALFTVVFHSEHTLELIRYIHNCSMQVTQRLRNQHIHTDLFLNISSTLHSLYRLYKLCIKDQTTVAPH